MQNTSTNKKLQKPIADPTSERTIPFNLRPFRPSDHFTVGHHSRIFNRVARVIHYSSDFVLYEARELENGAWKHMGIFRRPTQNFLEDYDQEEGREVEARIRAIDETNREMRRHG